MTAEAAVADAHRREWGYVLAATVRIAGNIDLAEDCVQEAYARALTAWSRDGVPIKPGAWLTTVAKRCALDALRRRSTQDHKLALLLDPVATEASSVEDEIEFELVEVPDDRLRLIFTCCHPSLGSDAQVALTLHLLCGLSTGDVARAFLVSEATMAARITRAKKKIVIAHIPYAVPIIDELPARIDAVLTVLHLLYTTGHTAPTGADLVRRDLVERALELARMLRLLLDGDADVAGLLALILLTDARRTTRVDSDGHLQLLADQDRKDWDRAAIAEGVSLVHEALLRRPPGRFALMAAIAAVHAQAPSWQGTDWNEIVGLYDVLVQTWPSPVVFLNRAVAIGLASGPAAGLAVLDELSDEPLLATYAYFASSRADFLRRLGRTSDARLAYEEALMLSENLVEREFLSKRLRELERCESDG